MKSVQHGNGKSGAFPFISRVPLAIRTVRLLLPHPLRIRLFMQEIILPFKGDPSLVRPAAKEFHCNEYLERHEAVTNDADDRSNCSEEEDEYHVSSDQVVMFKCKLPEQKRSLTFMCLEPSCGVLIEEENAAEKEEDEAMDPFFFDEGYTLAGKTGFQVWPGSRLIVEAMNFADPEHDSPQLTIWQERMASGAKVLELGSGVGVVGASLAFAGAQVLLTDLKTLVQNSTQPNLRRNANRRSAVTDEPSETLASPPSWLPKNAVRIGKGWAGSTAVDWTIPLAEQVQHIGRAKSSLGDSSPAEPSLSCSSSILSQVDVVIASDCVWLVSMMEPLFDTVNHVFQHNPNAKLLLSFQRRDGSTECGGSSSNSNNNNNNRESMFTTVDKILTTIQQDRKWSVQCLTWRYVNQKDEKEIFLFEVAPDRMGMSR